MSEIVYGLHAVEVLLKRNSKSVERLFIQSNRHDQRAHKLVKLAQEKNIPVTQKSREELDEMTDQRHQGVIAISLQKKQKNYHEKHIPELLNELEESPFILILDGVTDPHNLGACLRSADAAGVHMVIAPKDNAVGITDVVRKVACGAAESVPFIQVTNLVRTMKVLQEHGVWIAGTAGEAEQDIYQANLKGGLAIVMGAEGDGMRRLTRENCDFLIKIPMAGEVSSLNVSVATGVTLFEAVRQRSS
ncbi:23S rRNA (guanosine(2251)-2'-O)-methyltransferase RlmB [Kangiella sediminilitoris]|uniref:23S rRNA (guanosine-2'-O-)-methyltransferase RlmB n=1 Tax=Kangiella sediminilitoris TaxID=1144748 RepID=A0A1B3BCQ0_9GAMM|nr:23S rRNA (guanosine(2251)-2'-O)-methyltransferase RlmB [Kangiella sediminilitoris]AOE50589.1 23S rRNA (guanosine-2''''-O-)-methyltransferase [Kangiella sediminilitoris]